MPTPTTQDFVQRLYVAYYGRPADPEGLAYWAQRAEEQGAEAIIDAFGDSREFRDDYGDLSAGALIDGLYAQLFGRAPDAAGRDYYIERLESGTASLANIAVTVADAARDQDAAVLDARLAVADYYSQAVAQEDYDADFAGRLLGTLEGDELEAQVQRAEAAIDTRLEDGKTLIDDELGSTVLEIPFWQEDLRVQGGEGDDILVITDARGELALDGFNERVDSIETLEFAQRVSLNARDVTGVNTLQLNELGRVAHLDDDQRLVAPRASVGEDDALILDEPERQVHVTADFAADEGQTLQLVVNDADAYSGPERGNLTLDGTGRMTFDNASRGFSQVDASALEGGLDFQGAQGDYENVILSPGADALRMAERSSYYATDRIEGFDTGQDSLDVLQDDQRGLTVLDVTGVDDPLQAAVEASIANDNGYVAYAQGDSTFVYARQGDYPSRAYVQDGDFLIELAGTPELTDELIA